MSDPNTITKQEVMRDKLRAKISASTETVEAAVGRLQREGKIMRDFVIPIGSYRREQGHQNSLLSFRSNGVTGPNSISMHVAWPDQLPEQFGIHRNATGHLATKLGVPTKYLRTLIDSNNEWMNNLAIGILNQHMNNAAQSKVLVRAVGSNVRGVLSDSYRRMDSVAIYQAFIEQAIKAGAQPADGFTGDTKHYLEMLLPEPVAIETEKNGTVYMAFGARLSNSDFGQGSLELRSFSMQCVCLNGMVTESKIRQVHLGSKMDEGYKLSQETYALYTEAAKSEVKDAVRAIFNVQEMERTGRLIQGASAIEIDLSKEIKKLQKLNVGTGEIDLIEQVFMNNKPDDGIQGENTLWKLTQGITAVARDLEDRTRSRELQEIAGNMILKRVKLPA